MREWALALVGLGILFLPTGVFADTGPLIISEVMANPAEEDTDEFIEIVNAGATAVDITGWTFTDGDALDTLVSWTVAEHGALNDADWAVEKTVLEPGGIAVILDSEYATGLQGYNVPHGTLALTVENTTLGNALTTTDALTLFDAIGVVVSTYGTPKSLPNWQDRDDDELDGIPFNPGDVLSVERKSLTLGDVESNWVASESFTPGLLYTPPQEPENPEDDPDEDNGENDTPQDNPNNPLPNDNAPVYQDSADIALNEIFPNPEGSDTEKEFIELINKGTIVVDLSGWQLADAKSSFLLDGEKIAAGGILALDRSTTALALNNSGGETVTLKGPLSDVKDTVTYTSAPEAQSYHDISGTWSWTEDVSQGLPNVPFENTPPEAVMTVSKTVVRVGETIEIDASDSSDADDDALTYEWQIGSQMFDDVAEEVVLEEAGLMDITLTVSDAYGDSDTAQETVEVVGYDLSRDLLISEVLPNPFDSDDAEWIEIYNGGSVAVDLYGWTLTDKTTSYLFDSEEILKAKSYLLIKRETSGIALNNTGEEIFLIDPEEKIINGVELPKAIEGQSFARKAGTQNWAWTTTPTPGKENILTQAEDEDDEEEQVEEKTTEKKPPSKTATTPAVKKVSNSAPSFQAVTIAQVQDMAKGEYATVAGTVTAVPGERGVQKMFISDGEGELQIYSHQKQFPDVGNGDSVKVTGRVSIASGENRINISNASDVVILARAPEAETNVQTSPETAMLPNTAPSESVIGEVKGVQSIASLETPKSEPSIPWVILGILAAGLVVANWTFLAWQKKKWMQKPASENTWTVACETDDQ